MATTKFHSNVGEIVPWQAQYTFPSQATKSTKQTVKLVPKNGSNFNSQNRRVRFEFPSDGYLSWKNSVLKFDLETKYAGQSPPVVNVGFVEYDADNSVLYIPEDSTPVAVPKPGGTTQSQSLLLGGSIGSIAPGFLVRDKRGNVFRIVAVDTTTTTRTVSVYGTNMAVDCIELEVVRIKGESDWFNGDYTLDLNQAGLVTSAAYIFPNVRTPVTGGHALIKRLRVLYGGMVLEDIQEYSTIARLMYDTTVSKSYLSGAGSLLEGSYTEPDLRSSLPNGALDAHFSTTMNSLGLAPGLGIVKRQIILNCLSGLLDSSKLFPLKWMAAQFAIELELAPDADFFIVDPLLNGTVSYEISNVNMIAELHEFDSSFDYAFMTGLKSTGVPIKFNSWHWHSHPLQNLTQAQIHERARSIKAAFSVIRETIPNKGVDSDLFYHDLNAKYEATDISEAPQTCHISEYQYRIGGRYHPAQPVDCENGGAEAFLELSKTINSLGDFQFSPNISPQEWSTHYTESGSAATKFIMSMEFENKDVFPDTISGINGEEQSDINLSIKTSGSLDSAVSKNKQLWTFINYDALLVIRDGNIVELVM
jgi:hypothetical protein